MIKKALVVAALTLASIGFAGTATAAPGDNGRAAGVRGRACGETYGFPTVGQGLQYRRVTNGGNNAGGVPAALLEFKCP